MSQEPRGKKRVHFEDETPTEPVKMAKTNNNILSILHVDTKNFEFYFEELKKYILDVKNGNAAYIEDSACGKKVVYMMKTARFVLSNSLTIADLEGFLRPKGENVPFESLFNYFAKIYLSENNNKRRNNETQELNLHNIMKRPFFKAGAVFIALYLNHFDHFAVPFGKINVALDAIADFKQQDPVEFWTSLFPNEESLQFENLQMLSQYLYQKAETLYFKKSSITATQPMALVRTVEGRKIQWVCSKNALLPKGATIVSRHLDMVTAHVSLDDEHRFMIKHFSQMHQHKFLILLYFYKNRKFAHFYGCMTALLYDIFGRREMGSHYLISSADADLMEKRLEHFYAHGLWHSWSADHVLKTLLSIMILSTTKFVLQDMLFYWDGELQTCSFMRNKFIKMIGDHDDNCVCKVTYHMPHASQNMGAFPYPEWKPHQKTFAGVIFFFLYAFSAIPMLYTPINANPVEIDKQLDSFVVPNTFVAPPHYLTNSALIEME